MPRYSYADESALHLDEDSEGFERRLEDVREGLEAQGEKRGMDEEMLRQDPLIEVPNELFGNVDLEAERYLLEEEDMAVYIFDHSSGKLILGDEPMIACAMPEYVPEDVYTGLNDEGEGTWYIDDF